MKLRADVTELLRAGMTDRAIAAELGVTAKTAARHRDALGIAPHSVGRPAAASLQAAFEARTRPVDGGHLEWAGGYTDHGTPRFKHHDRPYSAYRVAFWIRAGVWPAGRVKPECEMPGCIAPAHVDDAVTRDRTRAAFAAITGYRSYGDACRRGHPYAEHGRWRSDGRRYCHTCQQQRRSATAQAAA